MAGPSPHRSFECPENVRQAIFGGKSNQWIYDNCVDDHGQTIGYVRLKRWRDELQAPNPNGMELRTKQHVEKSTGIPDPGVLPADIDTFGNTMWTALENYQAEIKKLDDTLDEVSVVLPEDKPAMVLFLSDLHIGHVECDMRKLREDLTAIKNTPGVYVILGGDLIDNVVTGVASRGMHHEALTNIDIQKYLAEELVEYLGADRIIAMLLGNHDEWSIKSDDFDPIRYLSRHIGCPYLGAFGFVNVSLGEQEYRILAAHQFRMNSSFNRTHAAKRLMDFIGDADVVFTGHKHDAAGEMVKVRQGARFFAQAGTYLQSSRYGKRLGFPNATAEMPGVLIFPGERDFEGFWDGISRLWMLDAARQRETG